MTSRVDMPHIPPKYIIQGQEESKPLSAFGFGAAAGATVSCATLALAFMSENKPSTFGAAADAAISCPMLTLVFVSVCPDSINEVKVAETNSNRLVHFPNAPHS